MISYHTPTPWLLVLSLVVSAGLLACNGGQDDAQGTDAATHLGDTQASGESQARAPRADEASAQQGSDFEQPFVASSTRKGVIPSMPPLDIGAAAFEEDLKQRKLHGVRKPLVGQKPSATYNAVTISPPRAGVYGAGLQVWKLDDTAAARARVDELRPQYLNIRDDELKGAHPHSFTAERAGIRTYLFATKDSAHVVALTCSTQVCPEWEDLVELGKGVEGRL